MYWRSLIFLVFVGLLIGLAVTLNGHHAGDKTEIGPALGPAKAVRQSKSPAAPYAAGDVHRNVVEGQSDVDTQTAPSQPTGTTLQGLVLDENETPVQGIEVLIVQRESGITERVRSDVRGQFQQSLEPGIYSVDVVRESVPERFAAPAQAGSPRPGEQTKFESQVVLIKDDQSVTEVELHIFLTSLIWGYVFDVNGAPIEGADVSLRYAGVAYQSHASYADVVTDATGRFEIRHSFPGNYRLTTYAYKPQAEWLADRPGPEDLRGSPVPIELSLVPGGEFYVGEILVGAPGVTVTGRLIDQDGEPFEGALVAAMAWAEPREGWRDYALGGEYGKTRTDADGRFELKDLPSEWVRVDLAADWEQHALTRRVATWWKPYCIDLRGMAPGDVHDMGVEFVPEARPYQLEIQFEFEPGTAQRAGLSEADLFKRIKPSIRLSEPGPELLGLSVEDKFAYYGGGGGSTLDTETRQLHFVYLPPPEPKRHTLFVEITKRGRGILKPIQLDFTPTEGATETMTVRVPSD
jgi:protocatechuate 3,4-dioxygenase beta subunit